MVESFMFGTIPRVTPRGLPARAPRTSSRQDWAVRLLNRCHGTVAWFLSDPADWAEVLRLGLRLPEAGARAQ
jgi:hypothetical protein